jgi:hypothetical protein
MGHSPDALEGPLLDSGSTTSEEAVMATIQFEIASPVEPDAVIQALTDFSERRTPLWPAIDPKVYRVHEVSDSSAVVTEGTDMLGGIWATERYEWDGSGTVRATIHESNFWHPGGTWELTAVRRDGGGSTLKVKRDRRAKNTRARVLELIMRLAGARVLAKELLKAPAVSGRTVSD